MANGIQQLTVGSTLSFQLAKSTSGFGNVSIGPVSESFSASALSGSLYSTQQVVNNGANLALDLCSGGLVDLCNNTISMKTIYGLQVLPASGSIIFSSALSGTPFAGVNLSGGGLMIPPGGHLSYCEPIASGFGQTFGASGSINFKATSGACLLTVNLWGL